MTEALTKQAGRCPKVRVTFGRYPSKLTLPLTGEFGMRNVLFDEAAELGVRALLAEGWSDGAAPPPKMEGCVGPPGVEG